MAFTIIKIVCIVLSIIILLILLLTLISINYDVRILKNIDAFKVYIDIRYFFNAVRLKGIYNKGFVYNMRALFFKFTNKKEVLRSDVPVKAITRQPIDEADYIFYDRDELLGDRYDVKSLKMSEKKNRALAKKREKKKDKKSVVSRIWDIIKGRKIDTVKYTFKKVKEVIDVIKPSNVDVKFDILSFDIKMDGKITLFRLIIIAIQVYFHKDTRVLLLG